MEQAAERLDFELAAKLRDRIAAIRSAGEKQDIMDAVTADTDIVAALRAEGATVISVLVYRCGRLYDQNTFTLSGDLLSENPLDEFLPQYYAAKSGADLPKTLLLEELPSEPELLAQMLSERAGHAVSIEKPVRGTRARLVLKAKQNAVEKLSMHSDRTGRELQASEELGRLLGMQKIPVRIESYDISNLASADMVAGMVVFENGRPLKAAYRKFAIKSLAGQNDYAAMQEVIRRRFGEYFKAQAEQDPVKNAANAFAVLPDLILLDGGQTHVAAIAPILAELHLDIPLFGMVKNDKHRTRAIAASGGEIAVRDKQAAFHLLTRIQDEVHRFSITYMKAKHKKSSFSLMLTAVPGIGEKKAQKLLMTFRTREQLLAASPEELAKAAGVKIETGNALWQYIKENM